MIYFKNRKFYDRKRAFQFLDRNHLAGKRGKLIKKCLFEKFLYFTFLHPTANGLETLYFIQMVPVG